MKKYGFGDFIRDYKAVLLFSMPVVNPKKYPDPISGSLGWDDIRQQPIMSGCEF